MRRVRELAEHLYGAAPRVFRAPGRVNLIGDHTDYNEGFVMPAAIGFSTVVAVAPDERPRLTIHSTAQQETIAIDLSDQQGRHDWSDYVHGIAVMLQRDGHSLRGAKMAIDGDVPLGAGLSSSASLEVAAAFSLLANAGIEMPRTEIAILCRRSENEFVGARVGIMDPFTACYGKRNHALLLDCRSLKFRAVPIPDTVRLAVCNTMVKHALSSGEYNRRREECEAGVEAIAHVFPGVRALRDVTCPELEKVRHRLDPVVYRRCRHVITENERTVAAAAALERQELPQFGRLMRESHRSLRDDYEVSCDELDVMQEIANEQPGVHGARMTGGGFGGCVIALVNADHTEAFEARVAERYLERTGIRVEIYICSAADGAAEEPAA